MQIGSVNNTFGVPGVNEHCFFLKTLEDAHNLRTHITDCFERASLPNVSRCHGSRGLYTSSCQDTLLVTQGTLEPS